MRKLVVGLFFCFTLFIGYNFVGAQEESRYGELQSFARVLNIIEKFYVEPIEIKTLVLGAIKGMLRELDPHSAYMSPEVFREFESETSGEFGGIGIEITIDNGQLTIISPIEDTPAWQAGIQAGDKIMAIDGKPTKGFNLIDASKHLKGRRGDSVTLTIQRPDSKPLDITITRGSVKVKSVKSQSIDADYLYIKVTSFIENTTTYVEKAIQDHLKSHSTLKGLILDLRRNPGGLLDQAVRMSDLFLQDGLTIVSTVGRDQKSRETATSTKRTKYLDFPILVLIDAGSASASEIVAGALQDHKRGLIMGVKSFGKGSVQSIMKLGDGSALKITVSRYYTPSGRSIQAEGITPDLRFEEALTQASNASADNSAKPRRLRESDMENHLQGEGGTSQKDKSEWISKDPMLLQAVNYVKVMAHKSQ